MTIQDIVKSIASLAPWAIEQFSITDQEELFEVICQRRIEQQEAEILSSHEELKQAISDGMAKKGNVHDLIADLLGDDDANCLGFSN
jgi:hypothetical protein